MELIVVEYANSLVGCIGKLSFPYCLTETQNSAVMRQGRPSADEPASEQQYKCNEAEVADKILSYNR